MNEGTYRRLMVFDGRMLRKIFGPKREEVRAGFRNLNTEEFHDLNSSPFFFFAPRILIYVEFTHQQMHFY